MKHIKKFNESNENLDVQEIMNRSLEYYEYIDEMGEKLANIISAQIEPLLNDNKFDEAKEMVRNFYEPSRYGKNNDRGDVIFIEYDMIIANINKRRMNHHN